MECLEGSDVLDSLGNAFGRNLRRCVPRGTVWMREKCSAMSSVLSGRKLLAMMFPMSLYRKGFRGAECKEEA